MSLSSPLSYRVCTRCVMDTSDPDIAFDEDGVCHHCRRHEEALRDLKVSNPAALEALVERIKREGQGKPYDCVIGVSGGVDSTYTAWVVKNLGLRPLAVHLDNGWNSEIAVRNIANTLQKLDIDLITHVIDWDEYRDIQKSFLLASVPDVEIPTDHAIITLLYKMAAKHKIRTIISGHNDATESHLPGAWSRGHMDYGYIHGIHKAFGSGRVKTFPKLSFFGYLSHVQSGGFNMVHILNYVDYSRDKAVSTIERELGWRDYGGKHHESLFTRWYQGYYLPKKFGFDKRRCHLSSLVSSGEISREEALAKLQQPTYDEKVQEDDCDYVAKKLGFSDVEFKALMAAKPSRFEDHPSYQRVVDSAPFRVLRGVRKRLKRVLDR